MTSENPEMLYSIAVEETEFEMLIIASIRTLKPGEKREKVEVFNLVKDSIYGVIKKDVIKKEVFNNLLDILVHNKSIKRNKIGNRECLYLPKETLQLLTKLLTSSQKCVDSSQTAVESRQLIEDSSQETVETLRIETFTQPNFEGVLILKEG